VTGEVATVIEDAEGDRHDVRVLPAPRPDCYEEDLLTLTVP